jgi:hypothetical protein
MDYLLRDPPRQSTATVELYMINPRRALLLLALSPLLFSSAFAAPPQEGAAESSHVALARMQGYTDTLIHQCENAGGGSAESDWLCAQSVTRLDQLAMNLQDVCPDFSSDECVELNQELSRIRGFVAWRRGLLVQ